MCGGRRMLQTIRKQFLGNLLGRAFPRGPPHQKVPVFGTSRYYCCRQFENNFLRISLPGIQTQRATLGAEKVEQRHFFQTDSSQGDKDTLSWCFWNLFTICQRFFQHIWSSQFLVQIRPNFSGPWNLPSLIRHPPLKLGFLVWRRFKWSAGRYCGRERSLDGIPGKLPGNSLPRQMNG